MTRMHVFHMPANHTGKKNADGSLCLDSMPWLKTNGNQNHVSMDTKPCNRRPREINEKGVIVRDV